MSKAKLIAFANLKGGVSKTFSTFNLAADLVKDGYRVLAIDSDPQANLTLTFNYDFDNEYDENDDLPPTLTDLYIGQTGGEKIDVHDAILETEIGVDLIPSDMLLFSIDLQLVNKISREFTLKEILKPVMDEYDYILIDCPPSLSLLTINIFVAVSDVVIPMQTSKYGLKGLYLLNQNIESIRSLNPDLRINGILFTMVQAGTNFGKGLTSRVRQIYGESTYVYNVEIPKSIIAEESVASCMPISDYDRSSKLAVSYRQFKDEFLERMK